MAGLRGRQMLRAASATPLGPRVDCVPVADVLAERDIVTQLLERIVHVHVCGVTANLRRKPSLECKYGSCVIDRKVEDLSRWQPTDVDGGCVELHVSQHLVQSKWWLLRGRRRSSCCWGCHQRIRLAADGRAQV